MAIAKAKRRQNRLAEVSEDVLQAGKDIVDSARTRAGKIIKTVEKNADALRERVEDSIDDLRDLDIRKLPKDLEKTYKKQSKQAVKAAKDFRKRVVKNTQALWKDLLGKLKSAGKTLESGVEPLIHTAGLASRNDLRRLESKLARISKRVAQLERGR